MFFVWGFDSKLCKKVPSCILNYENVNDFRGQVSLSPSSIDPPREIHTILLLVDGSRDYSRNRRAHLGQSVRLWATPSNPRRTVTLKDFRTEPVCHTPRQKSDHDFKCKDDTERTLPVRVCTKTCNGIGKILLRLVEVPV